nr:hypothetical protein CFP56_77010 [Quercus suber]
MSTQDSEMWSPVYLNPGLSEKLLSLSKAIVCIEDNSLENRDTKTVYGQIPEMTIEMMEECLMEPLPYLKEEYSDTVSNITHNDPSAILVSASNYGEKNLIFEISGCILSCHKDSMSLYIPFAFVTKTKDDLHFQGYSSKIRNGVSSDIFYRVELPHKLIAKCQLIYYHSRPKVTTPSHTPLYVDGMSTYCNVSLVVSIVLLASRVSSASRTGGTITVEHGAREIHIVVLDIKN